MFRRPNTLYNAAVKLCCVMLLVLAVVLPQAEADTQEVALLQIALDRAGFGVGFIDGREGARTRIALLDYCHSRGLSEAEAREALATGLDDAFTTHTVSEDDVDDVGVAPKDWEAAAQVPRMSYETIEEALSEKFHVKEMYLCALNPGIEGFRQGVSIQVPNVVGRERLPQADEIQIDCRDFRLRAVASNGVILASFPCSIAKDFERVPTGELWVASFAPNPNYVFDPANYPESPRAREIGHKLVIPPGPNTPVGAFWLSLSRPGFGIHGTPHPETIGRQESHGCFRLTNWDMVRLASMVRAGTPVHVVNVPP